MTMTPDYNQTHKHSAHHEQEILNSSLCICFYCLAFFTPDKIDDWIDSDQTAMCPYCGIDAVIGDASGYPISREFLEGINQCWF
jgi:hypothetical protein